MTPAILLLVSALTAQTVTAPAVTVPAADEHRPGTECRDLTDFECELYKAAVESERKRALWQAAHGRCVSDLAGVTAARIADRKAATDALAASESDRGFGVEWVIGGFVVGVGVSAVLVLVASQAAR